MGAPNGPSAAARVDVDPLVVFGGIGEPVHPVLVDLEPVAVAEMFADCGFDVVDSLEYAHDTLFGSARNRAEVETARC